MDITNFNNELRSINANTWGFGNEILYKMAKSTPLSAITVEQLNGAIWLIGRAYSASPQRRSYGKAWPVRTQNDGREGFFASIADKMHCNQKFSTKVKRYSDSTYNYDKSENDYKKLTASILTVLQFNLALSEALEAFDEVPSNHEHNNKKVYCSNHISFSSKFLHFYFPHSVFIIDNFARDGGKLLLDKTKKRMFDGTADDFDQTVSKEFSKKEVNKICKNIAEYDEIKAITEVYNNRQKNSVNTEKDNSTVKDYINHCIRSYLLGCYASNIYITPSAQILAPQDIFSMPRFTDAVFLNIKAHIKPTEKTKYENIKQEYHVSYLDIYLDQTE